MNNFTYSDELYHHGIQGMKWGVRRYQNEDGSLTPEGKVRYGSNAETKTYAKALNSEDKRMAPHKRNLIEATTKRDRLKKKKDSIVAKKTVNGISEISERDTKKIARLDNKIKKQQDVVDRETETLRKSKEYTDKIIETAQSRGYTVRSKEVDRWTVKGSDIVKSFVATNTIGVAAALAGSPVTPVFVPGKSVKGKKYKVNYTKNSEKSQNKPKVRETIYYVRM